ncbi:MAG: 3-phosphoshikimate 1-carboxyvinyltransferase [Acutalibacteraceae bacterium]|nr:3-phosphoshikimate 1-carboxyvinyltransferase [Acutalibacteraceae bacterium]
MTVQIKPSRAVGTVAAPPSKSAAHRALICAALSSGATVSNIAYSDDISATLDCLEKLGATVKRGEDSVYLGGLVPQNIKNCTLDCRESGSTLRFLIPLCMLSDSKVTFTGATRLFNRNLTVYEEIAKKDNIVFRKEENVITVCGKLKGGKYTVAGNISSQFISGLMFALPFVPTESTICVEGIFESRPYVAMTVDTLSAFGIIVREGDAEYKITRGQKYAARDITVEGDYSNAAFLDGFNLIGGDVFVTGLDEKSIQGDRIYKKMYADLMSGQREFDLSDCPDLAPVMFALSGVKGGAHFTGTARLKIKESDRAEVMRQELSEFGITVTVGENSVTVHGGTLSEPNSVLCGHNDHRIVMALSLLCSITGGEIRGAEAVSKSFPDYFDKIQTLGIEVNCDT